jgi:ABC-type uncharacterized transport system YnjBCD substrate-binding protein
MNRTTWLSGLALALLLAGCAKNKPPEIVALKAYPEEVSTGATAELRLTASDPEHGALKYKWTVKDGTLSGALDSSATWTAPDKPGSYKITAAVTDPKGAKTEQTVDVKVLAAAQMYSGSLNAPAAGGKKQRGKSPAPAPQPRKITKGTHAPKTTK